MDALIDKLFSENQADAIRKLWEDKSSRLSIQKEIGKALLDHDGVIEELPLTQLMLITSLSTFANSDTECCDVATIIHWGIGRNDILPYISDIQEQKEMAYKCLVSLGMFKKALIRRSERHGAPSASFYRNVGIRSFELIGKQDISEHFYQWECFMSELFV